MLEEEWSDFQFGPDGSGAKHPVDSDLNPATGSLEARNHQEV